MPSNSTTPSTPQPSTHATTSKPSQREPCACRFLAVHVGGTRRGGYFPVSCLRFGLKVSDFLLEQPGFPGSKEPSCGPSPDSAVIRWRWTWPGASTTRIGGGWPPSTSSSAARETGGVQAAWRGVRDRRGCRPGARRRVTRQASGVTVRSAANFPGPRPARIRPSRPRPNPRPPFLLLVLIHRGERPHPGTHLVHSRLPVLADQARTLRRPHLA
ncbi:DUF6302 family protein [Streptomyces sp. NPDC050428]|uniref:DUF6302 family protein n=1 Tax=Streptomyces sp. NPDC050428 TaxID=3155757 RepID=UPI0034259161